MAKQKTKKEPKVFDTTKEQTDAPDRNDPKFWREQLRIADAKAEPMEDKIRKYRRYYAGDQAPLSTTGDSLLDNDVVVNMVYRDIDSTIPAIISHNPRLYVTANKKPTEQLDTVTSALIVESLLNYYFEELQLKREITRCLIDARLGHWGLMQIGYLLETEKVSEIDEQIKADSVYAKRISPFNFRVDPTGTDHLLSDASWQSLKWVKTLKEVQDNPEYENTEDLKANTFALTSFKEGDKLKVKRLNAPLIKDNLDQEVKGVWDRVEGYHIWDKTDQRIRTIVFSGEPGENETVLRDIPWPQNYEGFPVKVVYFIENPDEQFPLPPVEIYIKQQDELNKMRSLQLEHIRKVSKAIYLVDKNAFDGDANFNITHGPLGVMVEVSGSIETAIKALETKAVPQDIMIIIRQLQNDIMRVQGTSDLERGVAVKLDTASEVEAINQGISILRASKQAVVEDFTIVIMKTIAQVLQQTLDVKQEFRVSSDNEEQLRQMFQSKIGKIVGTEEALVLLPWIKASKKDIQGEFDYKMEVGSMRPVNKETRKQDAIQLAKIFEGSPLIRPREGAKRILEAFEEHDIDKLLKTSEELKREQKEAQKLALQTKQAEEQPKFDADFRKTEKKSETAIMTTLQKALAALEVARIGSQGREGK